MAVAWKRGVAAALLVAVFVGQAVWAARTDSVTIDEFAHLPVGLYYLFTGDYSVDPINPPLPRMLAAAAVTWHAPEIDTQPQTSPWAIGYDFQSRNVERYAELFAAGRLTVVALAVLTGLLVLRWAAELYGPPAGLAALALFSVSPSMLAHGHLITLDVPGAFGFTLAAYAAWQLMQRPGWARAALLGAAIGAATLLKLSAFVLGLAIVAVVVVRAIGERDVGAGRWAALLGVAALAGLSVLNAGYGFFGTLAPLSTLALDATGTLGQLAERWPGLRLPLPSPFVEGVDMVLNVGKSKSLNYFLAGELSAEGWWYYHLAAFALKTPVALLVLSGAALLRWVTGTSGGRYEYCLFVPVVTIFVANTLFNSLYIGVRHVLPAYPLLLVACGGVVGAAFERGSRVSIAAVAALVVWLAAANASVAPRYLAYFNEFAGGADGGHRWLVDSNLDWGQDLARLRREMDARGWTHVNLAYFGRVDPRVYGVPFAPLVRGSTGPTAVSATFLMGRPYLWYVGNSMRWTPADNWGWMREYEPVGRAGTMFLYDLAP